MSHLISGVEHPQLTAWRPQIFQFYAKPNIRVICGCSTLEIKCHIVPNFNISKVRYQKILQYLTVLIIFLVLWIRSKTLKMGTSVPG